MAFILQFFIDMNEVSNEEGFVTLAVIAGIMIYVGVKKVSAYTRTRRTQ